MSEFLKSTIFVTRKKNPQVFLLQKIKMYPLPHQRTGEKMGDTRNCFLKAEFALHKSLICLYDIFQ